VSKTTKTLIIVSFLSCLSFFGQVKATDAVNPIYSMAISGNVILEKLDSYARIILTDVSGNEYLVYEAQGPFDSGSFSFENTCEETCVLDGVIPKSVDVELSSATLTISQLATLEDKQGLNQQVRTMGIKSYASGMDNSQEQSRIDKINQYIKDNNLKWTAGETSISGYSYQQKKDLFILPGRTGFSSTMPCLEGFDYYKRGVFEMPGSGFIQPTSTNLPNSFSWRNRHGENWVTPVRSQKRCGSCWAFSASGAVETATNLYFNQHLNLDLSEQELVSCVKSIHQAIGLGGACYGENPNKALDYYKNQGVTTEDCFSYRALFVPCSNVFEKCNNQKIKISDKQIISFPTERKLKEAIIKYGPLSTGIITLGHAMTLIGWEIDPQDNTTVWAFKNSWDRRWGEDGYVRMKVPIANLYCIGAILPPVSIADKPNLEISCVDKDNDSYCNWGISENKPKNCPSSCKTNKDCDDSDPYLGAFDQNFNCINITPSTKDTNPPTVGRVTETSYGGSNKDKTFEVWVSDIRGVAGCNLFIQNKNVGPMKFSESPCLNCTASKDHHFEVHGNYSVQVECRDESSNVAKSQVSNIDILGCPDCQNRMDYCEDPPKCEKECGATQRCDEKESGTFWPEGNICYVCSSCNYVFSYISGYSPYYLKNDNCYYDCSVDCTFIGWQRKNCYKMSCSQTKISGNNCYYNRVCGSGGCNYSNSDTNKKCSQSKCTTSGWDNNPCQNELDEQDKRLDTYNKELYLTEGFNNSNDYIDGSLYCDSDDSMTIWECVPDDNNDAVKYSWQTGDNGWFCGFECNGWCTADGTIRITCQP